jgi:hypothetical protein
MKDETMPDATLKALSALDAMSELWGAEVNLRGMVNNISGMPRLKMIDAIEALALQAFVEGAYRHHCDVKDGKVPGMTYNDSLTGGYAAPADNSDDKR